MSARRSKEQHDRGLVARGGRRRHEQRGLACCSVTPERARRCVCVCVVRGEGYSCGGWEGVRVGRLGAGLTSAWRTRWIPRPAHHHRTPLRSKTSIQRVEAAAGGSVMDPREVWKEVSCM